MARIRLRLGDSEIEVDSRDIYVDNRTIGSIIDGLSQNLSESRAKLIHAEEPAVQNNDDQDLTPEIPVTAEVASTVTTTQPVLGMLDDAEVYEPEFVEPQIIPATEIPSKLVDIESTGFFQVPRTVTETVQRLRESGWAANTFDVSKAMVMMAVGKRLVKSSMGIHACYTSQKPLFVS